MYEDMQSMSGLNLPPHSQQAEQAVLGGLMIDSRLIDEVSELIQTSDFFAPKHRIIYEAIHKVYSAGDGVDLVTVCESIPDLDEIGGIAYVAEIAMNTPSATNTKGYAKAVKLKAQERAVIAAGTAIMGFGYDKDMTIDEKIASAQQSVMTIGESSEEAELTNNEVLKNWVAALDDRFTNGTSFGLPTGFKALDERFHGLHGPDLIILAARPAMGKAQPLDSEIVMADGSKVLMGKIRYGQAVASIDGGLSIVTGVYPQGDRPIYRLTMSDGRIVKADESHLWNVESSRWKEPRVMTTLELKEKLTKVRFANRIRLAGHNGKVGFGTLDMSGWLLGFLLGDGCLTNAGVRFSNPEQYIIDRVELESGLKVHSSANGNEHNIFHALGGTPNPIREKLKALGVMGKLAHEKFIPEVVFSRDKVTRQAVLAGLLESDGWVQNNSVQFSSSSEDLSDGVIRLVQSLGGSARKRVKSEPKYFYKGDMKTGRPAYIVSVALDGIGDFIQSPRLLDNMSSRKSSANPTITSIEFVGNEPAQCIMVSHPSHLYLTDGYLVTHNTTLALNMAETAAITEGKPVLIFSLEMSRNQLYDKMVSSVSGIKFDRIKKGTLEGEDWPRLSGAVAKMKDRKIHVLDRAGMHINQIAAAARRINRKEKLGLIVVDYLQLIRGDGNSRTEQVGSISRGLKGLAKELDCPVMALSQLSREVEKRPNKRPVNADLRDSGEIEQDADIIMFIYRDEVYNENSNEKGIAEIITTKHRGGEIGTDRLVTRLDCSKFENLAYGYEPPPPMASKKTDFDY